MVAKMGRGYKKESCTANSRYPATGNYQTIRYTSTGIYTIWHPRAPVAPSFERHTSRIVRHVPREIKTSQALYLSIFKNGVSALTHTKRELGLVV